MATRNKRKWQEYEDSDDEEPLLGKQILPVANLPLDFNQEPSDGLQYLFLVRRDARSLPHVTRVANPYEISEPPAPAELETLACQGDPNVLPSEEWRSKFNTRFRNFKKNICQPTICVHFDRSETNRKMMPDKKERDLWWKFLAGQPESDWNPPKKLKAAAVKKYRYNNGMRAFSDQPEDFEPDVYDDNEGKDDHETWRINPDGEVEMAERSDPVSTTSRDPRLTDPVMGEELSDLQTPIVEPALATSLDNSNNLSPPREPTPLLLRKIDHRMSIHLLMYFTHWINLHLQQPTVSSLFITDSHARWMFALLAKIEDQLSADDMSLLRNLARACSGLLTLLARKDSSPTEQQKTVITGTDQKTHSAEYSPIKASSCWLIFTAIVSGWGQRDLWMDAESMLSEAN
ncbi:survival motor neuron interacting protein 1-domain-containing protein [Hygrophoropsis aurantiaca]|uniref:Survival motor neuron interacting protein 1-domain-containing protein n=1 Tax=Hygrophoropsis aurantiaca TaxID=72124 RepID=A0ACB8ANB4_9AGAM|nr:survival motor neuron interacting protein 1-domain-containing protein [Hygrophoropsis aurantiaca]